MSLFKEPTDDSQKATVDLKATVKLTLLSIATRNLIAVVEQERPGGMRTENLRRALREAEKALVKAEERTS